MEENNPTMIMCEHTHTILWPLGVIITLETIQALFSVVII